MGARPVAHIRGSRHTRLMQRFKPAFVALTAMMSVSAPASAGSPPCTGFETGGSSPLAVDQFYAARTITIVRAALKGDTKALAGLVAPGAVFSVWHGDAGFGSRQSGVPGVIELVRLLRPVHFQIASDLPGPVILRPLKCEWTTTMIFRTEAPDEGAAMKFEFADGLLVRATGRAVVLTEGDVR